MRLIDADALRAEFKTPTDWLDSKQVFTHVTGIWATIDLAPTVEPEQKTGRWILKEHLYECDKCGCRISRFPFKGNIWNYYFCPNCGAKMEEGGQDEQA